MVAGVILAGGQARRMGGGDKPLLPLGGAPMLARVIAQLSPQAGPIALSANGDPARFAAFDLPVLADSMPDYPGPLAGILAAMDWARAQGDEAVVTVAGDTPFFPPDLVARLVAAGPFALAATVDGPQPTFGLWPVALAGELRAALRAGQRQVRRFAETQGAVFVSFEAPAAFFNVNTPDDLAAARARLAEEEQ